MLPGISMLPVIKHIDLLPYYTVRRYIISIKATQHQFLAGRYLATLKNECEALY